MKLIILDLDQTLVDFISVHDEALRRLFRKFFGVDARFTEIDFAGKSFNESFHELARLKNIPEDAFQKKSHQLLESYETSFSASFPRDVAKYILPGAKEILRELAKTEHLVVLYTGDSPGVVARVLSATGLGKYFNFCFYGTEVKVRADMVRLAIEKAQKVTGQEFEGKNVIVIGDSIRDIECGKLFGALTIAIATGFHSQEELSKAGPDYLFKDLKDYKKVLEAIARE